MADEMEIDACLVNENSQRTGYDKFRLGRMQSSFVERMDIVQARKLSDLLRAKGIFNSTEYEIVLYEQVTENAIRKLLGILKDKVDNIDGSLAFDVFVNFLKDDCGDEELAQELIEADGYPEWYKEALKAIEVAEGMKLSDKILGGVLRHIGENWKSVALQLDISNVKIENIVSVTRNSYEQKFKVFNAWQNKSGYLPGGLVVLLKAFMDAHLEDDSCTVDWPRIYVYLKENKNK